MSDPATLAWLAGAALLAGTVDAIVGGGGLIQLPALLLLLPGAAPAQLLATNKFASVWGTTASALTYRRRVGLDAATVVPLAGAAFVGAVGGAIVGLHLPKTVFYPLILLLLILVGGWTLAKPSLGVEAAERAPGRRRVWGAAAVGLLIGGYDGLLGPGTGSFFVFALVAVAGYAFLKASASAKIANVATNLGALAVFAPRGQILWAPAVLMAVANLVGGTVGARLAIRLGSRFVRAVFLTVVAGFILRIGWSLLAGS